jgi:hypothetical protein
MTKLEEVARAIYLGRNGQGARAWARLPKDHKAPYLVDAKAAVKAMRIPSSELLYSAEYIADVVGDGGGIERGPLVDEWQAMIDAILSEGDGAKP